MFHLTPAEPWRVRKNCETFNIAMPHSLTDHPRSVYLPLAAECALATDLPWYRETFIAHACKGNVAVADSAADADVVVIFEYWDVKDESKWKQLLDDPFLQRFAAKCYSVSHDDFSVGFMPGCYTSLAPRHFDPRWHRASAYPNSYHWAPTLEELLTQSRRDTPPEWLYSFQGNTASHKVRGKLQSAVISDPRGRFEAINQKFWSHTVEQRQSYVEDLLNAKFSLCPRGFSPATHRLFESMQAGRCPVIIANHWIAPEGPDWASCSVRIKEQDVASIPALLAKLENQAESLGIKARREWETWFAERPRFENLFTLIGELWNCSRSQPPRDVAALQQRLRNWRFRWNAGWTKLQALARKLGLS